MKLSRLVLAVSLLPLFALGIARAEKFTAVILPDTQYYLCDEYHSRETYLRQTQWIADSAEALNIKFVAHMGDITDANQCKSTDDQSEEDMWKDAVKAQNVLHTSGIPFSVVLGNHDYDSKNIHSRETTRYTADFSSFNPPWYDGHMGSKIDNTFTTFSAEGLDFLVVSLEFAPTKDALCWADSVIENHPAHRVIVVTHGYMGTGGNRCKLTNPGGEAPWWDPLDPFDWFYEDQPPIIGSDGWNIWDELVQRHNNIFMVLCGHVNDSEHRQRLGLAGNVIHEILTDFQYESPKGKTGDDEVRYGNGWLRLLEFDPEGNKINVRTVSIDQDDPQTFHTPGSPQFYATDRSQWGDPPTSTYSSDPSAEDHQFSLDYDMTSGMSDSDYKHTRAAHFHTRTVNLERGDQQRDPAIAMDQDGNFVIVWEDDSNNGNDYYDIWGAAFYSDGSRRSGSILINSGLTGGQQLDPDIAMDEDGNFVVVWADDNDDNGSYDIRGSAYTSSGGHRWGPYRINDGLTAGQQKNPAIAMNPESGFFVVVWEDDYDKNGYYDIRGAGFDSNGDRQFPLSETAAPIRINSGRTDGQQLNPDIAMDKNGKFVVVWEDDADKNKYYDIWGAKFDSSGTRWSGPKLINSGRTDGQQLDPDIAMDKNGKFIVVWEDDYNKNDYYDIRGAIFGCDSAGTQQFGDILINSGLTDGQQLDPEIAMDKNGKFVVVWADDNDKNDYYDISWSRFDANGIRQYGPLDINSSVTGGQQKLPAIAMNPGGGFVTTWQDDCDKNDYTDIVARGIQFYNLTVDSEGGGTASSDTSSGPSGSMIRIYAQPSSTFSYWTGGAENPTACSTYVFLDGNRTVTAHFESETSVLEVEDSQNPYSFSLDQNYPNPFNPSTVIQFELPKRSHVSVAVFNMLGQKVIDLVNEEYPAGKHQITWNSESSTGRSVAAGIYFYRIVAGDNISSRKMVLLK